jgi:PLD-like domain
MGPAIASNESKGLRVVAYAGENTALIAMTLPNAAVNDTDHNLAGFAIWRTSGGKPEVALPNRLSFDTPITAATKTQDSRWIPSTQAPFQYFRWVDVPPDGLSGKVSYRVKALYFTGQGKALKDGPEVTVDLPLVVDQHKDLHASFTRGYIASQAYADKFHNAPIRPAGAKTVDFDTKPFEAQYAWLGADARKSLFAFLADCESDKTAKIDLLAYDLDEPDAIAAICKFGKEGRLRAILDNASLHTKKGAAEIIAAKMIIAAAGKDNVKQGHFARFQHNKVFIKRDAQGVPQSVLFGSMNFSIRGLYVQSNNVIVVNDPTVAKMFGDAFDTAFNGNVQNAAFAKSPIAQKYFVGSASDTADLPEFSLAFSPHTDSSISLGPVSQRIQNATSSVLFAVMEPTGGGPVLSSLRTIAADPTVFSYGTVQTDTGLAVQTPDGAMSALTSFAYLKDKVPPPFNQEWDGGPGQTIHDKFVVVDFNTDNPVVFTGSSNLAGGGEEQNGDNLVMIEDSGIANMYAIEAVKIFDHYHFRKNQAKATTATPLTLWYPGKPGAPNPWWKPYYDPKNIKLRDRCLFANIPLPAGLDTRKNVDWSALAKAPAKTPGKAPAKSKSNSASTSKTKSKTKSKSKSKTKSASKKKSKSKTKATTKKKSKMKSSTKKKSTAKKTSKKTSTKVAKKKAPARKKTPAKKKKSTAKKRR